MTRIGIILVATLLLGPIGASQTPIEFGPYPVGTTGVFDLTPSVPTNAPPVIAATPGSDAVAAMVYYPANPQTTPPIAFPVDSVARVGFPFAPGRFPVVFLLHGWGSHPLDYEDVLAHIASWGFVVVAPIYVPLLSNVTPTYDDLDPVVQAKDAWALLRHLEVISQPGSGQFVSGHLALGPNDRIAVVGHSMGAVGAYFFSALDPRVGTIVALNPYVDTLNGQVAIPPIGSACNAVPPGLQGRADDARPFVENYGGGLFLLAGNLDPFAPVAGVEWWFDRGAAGNARPRREIMAVVDGMGHFSVTDFTRAGVATEFCGYPTAGDMLGEEQHAVARAFVNIALRSEMGLADDSIYRFMMGSLTPPAYHSVTGAVVPFVPNVHSYCREPINFIENFGGSFDIVYAGRPGDPSHLFLFLPEFLGFLQLWPSVDFDYEGWTRIDPEIPPALQIPPAFLSSGIRRVGLPLLFPQLPAAFAWWVPRSGGVAISPLAPLFP